MMFSLTTTHRPATDLGYLLHKHPDRAFHRAFPWGRAHVVWTEGSDERATAALILDIDPTRRPRGHEASQGRGPLSSYVHDRPYVANALLSVAMAKVFGSALAGTCSTHPAYVDTVMPLEVHIPVLACSGGPARLRRLFEPLGYRLRVEALPDGLVDSALYDVTLQVDATVQTVLRHLFVLLPVVDDAKRDWMEPEELDKLRARGAGWLEKPPPAEPDAMLPTAAVPPHAASPIVDDLLTEPRIETRFRTSVFVPTEHIPAASASLSSVDVDLRWLIHLPPTQSPTASSNRPDRLEHPEDAFDYYRTHLVDRVVIEPQHRGSRATVILGRDPHSLAARFGFSDLERPGIVLTRQGRRFFTDPSHETHILDVVGRAFTAEGLWDELDTDWALIDATLMDGSASAAHTLEDHVGLAARTATATAVRWVERAMQRTPSESMATLHSRAVSRHMDALAFTTACQHGRVDVRKPTDLRLAPFHLLATEGDVHTDQPHPWHLNLFARLATHDEVLVETPWREVPLDDTVAVADAIDWWTVHTAAGGQGMIIKPADFLVSHRGGLLQPALKCRGVESLRTLYGPEYLRHLGRLRRRTVNRRRKLASKEFVLGLEALSRFVDRDPLQAVTACVLGILALEHEPRDPRL